MRDLSRFNAKFPAYKLLQEQSVEFFTPMRQVVRMQRGKKIVEEVPILHTLLFVHGNREELDPVVRKIENLQYLFLKGASSKPTTVPDDDMYHMILATSTPSNVQYFTPEELKSDKFKVGSPIRINGGEYDGCKGRQFSVRGSRKKYILVELRGYLSAAVEVKPEYIEFL